MNCPYCGQYAVRGVHEHCLKRDKEIERPNEPEEIDLIEEQRMLDREAVDAGDTTAQLRVLSRRRARA